MLANGPASRVSVRHSPRVAGVARPAVGAGRARTPSSSSRIDAINCSLRLGERLDLWWRASSAGAGIGGGSGWPGGGGAVAAVAAPG